MNPCVVDSTHAPIQKVFVRNGTDIYLCPDCGCLLADIDFNKAQYETAAYYTMSLITREEIENKWALRWRYVLSKIRSVIRDCGSSTLSLLDVGNGYFVSLASSEFGFRAQGLGISAEEINFARDVIGVQLINEEVGEHRINYDVVTCFNVIEHVVDPQSFLSALVDRVNPGGILVLSTPNTTCLRARIRGLKKWERIDPPHHINLFPRNALRYLVKRHGLEEVCYETLSTYITLVNTRNLMLRRLFFHFLKLFNLGADHFLIVRKPLGKVYS
jgi:2-polyprenyl-3-methyl-5-hydroxy-6-metoxy-1,4-benzoquinol methylase